MAMQVDKDLEIIIPTFNRSETLKNTVQNILVSPVGSCRITILDNNSTDNTAEVVRELAKNHNNIVYIKNRFNLGLAGNICKALTLPTAKYFWIVFDDTGLDFANWNCIEEGLKQDYDCILTTNYYDVKNSVDLKERAAIFLMLIFCFAGIYKTDLITDDVVLYALNDIYTVHSQMALISAVFNDKNRKIYIPEKTIAFPQVNPETAKGEEYSFNRTKGKFCHFRISHGDFIPGFLAGLQSLDDELLQKECVKLFFEQRNGIGPFSSKRLITKIYKKINKNDLTFINYLDEKYFLENKYKIMKLRKPFWSLIKDKLRRKYE